MNYPDYLSALRVEDLKDLIEEEKVYLKVFDV